MAFTYAQAQAMLAAAQAKAAELNLPVSISVLDAGGYEVAFARMDGAGLNTIETAHGKAYGVVLWNRPSAALREWAEARPVVFDAVKNLGLRTIVPGPGGLQIPGGGAIAVTGAPSGDDDVAIAQAGLAALGRS